ncbi:MAG: hypothetical protein K2Q18_02305 [Bdellovibrionales bacterium]|nr:hypothetical protein [Bdellovibrionales bacterium]
MFNFKKKKDSDISESTDITTSFDLGKIKDRLFFHDLINQTHGLLLFFENKELRKTEMSASEMQMVKKEIKTLQSLVRDHYNYKHKNLHQTYEWIPFNHASMAFESLSQTYFQDTSVSVSFNVEGVNAEESLIYYPTYYRILNNLIKNISESKAREVKFSFTLNEKGFFLETKNFMEKVPSYSENLANIILEEKVKPVKSLGLDSIHHLAEESGGHFSFEIFDNTWINRLFLPVQNISVTVSKIPA